MRIVLVILLIYRDVVEKFCSFAEFSVSRLLDANVPEVSSSVNRLLQSELYINSTPKAVQSRSRATGSLHSLIINSYSILGPY